MSDMTTSKPQPMQKLDSHIKKNTEFLNHKMGIAQNFDVIYRQLEYAGTEFALYFVDGFAKDSIMRAILWHLSKLQSDDLNPNTIEILLHTQIAYLEVETIEDMGKLMDAVLAGQLALLVDGYDKGILIDARTYPARSPAEPDTERVVRGARDGFTETLIFNTALTRRRLRDPSLRMEYIQIGKRSKTDVCISYIADIANEGIVQEVRNRLKEITVDGLPMADKTIEEFVFKNKWNPYPMVRYTERPDVAAIHLLEGHVLIYTDTSPSVMIAPSTFFHHVQHAEEYRQKPIIGAYLRWVRFLGMLASIFLLPIWYLLIEHPHLFGYDWGFVLPQEHARLPLVVQFLVAELGIDLLRMAAIHTPNPLGTALGLVAALMMGQVAIKVGVMTYGVILYLSVAAIGTFATPSYELGLANRLVRLTLLLMAFLLQLPGFIVGVLFWFILLARTKSLNTHYLWPLLPFNGKALWDILLRAPVPSKDKRPYILNPQDPDRTK